MGIFDDEDDFLNEDDFINRWEKFNKRMTDDEEFRKEMEKSKKDFQDLMRMLFDQRNFETPLDFRIIPLFPNKNDFNMSENDMDIEKGKDGDGEWETKNWTSPDGSISYSSFSRSSGFGDLTDSDGMAEKWDNRRGNSSDEVKKLKLIRLQKSLDRVVEQERYEKAAEIKKMMDEIKSNNKEVSDTNPLIDDENK